MWGKRGVLSIPGSSLESRHSPKHTPWSPRFDLHFPVPEGFLALIREKTALLFWESAGSLPIRLSEAISQLEITANSTYWMANLPPIWMWGSGMGECGEKGSFIRSGIVPRIQTLPKTYTLISPIWPPFSRSGRLFSTNSGKNSTIVLGFRWFSAHSAVGGYIAAGNHR